MVVINFKFKCYMYADTITELSNILRHARDNNLRISGSCLKLFL